MEIFTAPVQEGCVPYNLMWSTKNYVFSICNNLLLQQITHTKFIWRLFLSIYRQFAKVLFLLYNSRQSLINLGVLFYENKNAQNVTNFEFFHPTQISHLRIRNYCSNHSIYFRLAPNTGIWKHIIERWHYQWNMNLYCNEKCHIPSYGSALGLLLD